MEKYELYIIVGILLLFAGLRLPYLFQESVWNDETVYMWMGNELLENPGFLFSEFPASHSYGYLFSTLIAFFNIFFSSFRSARIVTLLFSVATGACVYIIGRKTMGRYAGIVATLLVAFNALHIFITDRALLDVPIAAVFTAIILALVQFEPEDARSGIVLGSLAFAAFLTKTSGFLAVPAIFLALVVTFPDWKRWMGKGLIYGALIVALAGAVYIGNNYRVFGNFMMGDLSKLSGTIVFGGSRTYYIENASIIYSLPVFILGIAGMILSFLEETRLRAASSFILFHTFFFSFMVGEKVLRYALPTVPAMAVMAVYAVYRALEKMEIPKHYVLAAALLSYFAYMPAGALLEPKSVSYTGFQELGEQVAELDSVYSFSTIYAQSARQIRAFSGINYFSNGGRIRFLPESLDGLEGENVLLQIDMWEYAAPEWAYPLDQAKLNAILARNFTIVGVVERNVPTQSGMQKGPVGFLLAK